MDVRKWVEQQVNEGLLAHVRQPDKSAIEQLSCRLTPAVTKLVEALRPFAICFTNLANPEAEPCGKCTGCAARVALELWDGNHDQRRIEEEQS